MTDMRLHQLVALTGLIRDRALEDLRRATAARDETRARIADLAVPTATDLPPVAEAQAALAYQRWADEKRRQLNMQLARQMVTVMQRHSEARHAFGRAEVVNRLTAPDRR